MIDDRKCDISCDPPLTSGHRLVMMMGLPRAGKSTWAMQQGVPVVCLDAIRLAKTGQRWWGPIEHEIWPTARTMVRALFLAGHPDVILDITSLKREHRSNFKCSSDVLWKRYVQIIDTDVEVCKQRALETYPELEPIIDWFYEHKEPIDVEHEDIEIWGEIRNGQVIVPSREFYRC